jgi:hypothetical protein
MVRQFRALLMCSLLLTLLTGGIACKKVKEDLARRFIISAMTDGRWLVDKFTEDTEDITASFNGYEFQFEEDGKVYAILGASQEEGTWVGDVNALTIFSNFPGATAPLSGLNDTWKVTNNTTKLVEAEPVNSARKAYLKLVKKN